MGELHAELRLADARGAQDDGQRAGNQPAAEQVVETGDAGFRRRGAGLFDGG